VCVNTYNAGHKSPELLLYIHRRARSIAHCANIDFEDPVEVHKTPLCRRATALYVHKILYYGVSGPNIIMRLYILYAIIRIIIIYINELPTNPPLI